MLTNTIVEICSTRLTTAPPRLILVNDMVMSLGVKKIKTPDSEIKFGCEQNIRSMHEGLFPGKNEQVDSLCHDLYYQK